MSTDPRRSPDVPCVMFGSHLIRREVDDARDAYLSMSEEQYDAHDNYGYDQYEVCVPLRLAGGCLRAIADDMEAVNAWDPVGFMDPGPGI